MNEEIKNDLPTLPSELQIKQESLVFNSAFQNLLNTVSSAVNHAQHLASIQSVDQLDEQSLENAISDLQTAQVPAREVNKIRKELKKYLKGRSDNILAQFDAALDKAHFNELTYYDAQAKQLKKDLSAYRINQRWEKLKETFELNLQNYPLIQQLAPALTNFDLFRMRHTKLVTGAKSYHLGDKQLKVINQDLYMISNCLADLKANDTNLAPAYQNSVLQSFIKNPDEAYYYQLKNNALVAMKRDYQAYLQKQALLKQQAAEKQKQDILSSSIEELTKQANTLKQQISQTAPNTPAYTDLQSQLSFVQQTLSQKQNDMLKVKQQEIERQKQLAQAQQKQVTLHDQGVKWLGDYVMVHMRQYGNLKNDNSQKVSLIFDLMTSLNNPSSDFYSFLQENFADKAKKDERDKIILSIISEILNV